MLLNMGGGGERGGVARFRILGLREGTNFSLAVN